MNVQTNQLWEVINQEADSLKGEEQDRKWMETCKLGLQVTRSDPTTFITHPKNESEATPT